MISNGPAQLTGAVEYTDCKTLPKKCPGYDIRPSDGDALAL